MQDNPVVTLVEFWPDYGPGPLWTDGRAVDLRSLDLPSALIDDLESWNSRYAEDKIPLDSAGDTEWLAQGRSLLDRTRAALGPGFQVVVTEPWWGEEPT